MGKEKYILYKGRKDENIRKQNCGIKKSKEHHSR
jgi:hypothetical protein